MGISRIQLLLILAALLFAPVLSQEEIDTTDNDNSDVPYLTDEENSNVTYLADENNNVTYLGTVPGIVTAAFFNGIISLSSHVCEGKKFYTRTAFLSAARAFPQFGNEGNLDTQKREMAAFFAHVTQETSFMCYINEIGGKTKTYCDKTRKIRCAPGKRYYGRGALQLTWNYNYAAAGRAVRLPLLSNPDMVAGSRILAFKTAVWFWMNNCHPIILRGGGFGATIKAINSAECNPNKPQAMNNRVRYFLRYCKQLNVSPGGNLRCSNNGLYTSI